jgi:hypothetical protein
MVLPAVNSLQSRLPPNSRGSLLFWRPKTAAGATANWPKNGARGILKPEGMTAWLD